MGRMSYYDRLDATPVDRQERTRVHEDRWPTNDERPATCPVCGIAWESTDLRRHHDRPLPWWRCADCGAEWNETTRKHAGGGAP